MLTHETTWKESTGEFVTKLLGFTLIVLSIAGLFGLAMEHEDAEGSRKSWLAFQMLAVPICGIVVGNKALTK